MSIIEKTNVIGAGLGIPLRKAGVPGDGTSEVQRLTIGATPTGGTFKLSWNGFTTAAITWSATTNTLLANIQAALDALPNLAANEIVAADVNLSGGAGALSLTFGGNSAKRNVPAIAVADNSLTGTGATLAITTTTPGVDADGLGAATGATLLDTTNSVLYQNTGTPIAPNWVNLGEFVAGDIQDDAVTTSKILDANVTAAKLAADAVETAKIKDLNVTEGKLAAKAVTNGKIGDLAVDTGQLAAGAVETAKIKDSNVTAAKLADAVADRLVGAPTIGVGTEDANVVTLTLAMKDAQGNALASRVLLTYWVSDAAGGAPCTVAPDGGIAATTGMILKELDAGKSGIAMSDATGALVLTVTETGAKTAYLNVAINGVVTSSAVMTWAGA